MGRLIFFFLFRGGSFGSRPDPLYITPISISFWTNMGFWIFGLAFLVGQGEQSL